MLKKLSATLATMSLVSVAALTATPVGAQTVSPTASASPSASAASRGTATVRVVHASPDAPAVDVYVDDKRTLSSVTFRRVSGYLSLPAGRHTIKIYPTTARGTGNPTLTTDVDLNQGWDYTIAAIGRLANIQAKVFSDNLNLPSAGKSKVRAYHLSPNGPGVNVMVRGGDTLIRNLSYPNATDYLEVDAKRYDLDVQSATNSAALLSTSANLAANSVQSVFVFGLVGETPAASVVTTIDRRGAATPATGAEQSFSFMLLVAGMVAATGVALKKIAVIQERS